MKARPVKGLRAGGTLADNLERIVRVRSAELHAFMPRAADVKEVRALHDMRIAAKRLRYILEISEDCFGPYAATAAKRAKDLQDVIGEIHDCDVTTPRVRALIKQARVEDVAAVIARAPHGAEDLDPRFAADAPNADAYRGLEAMATYLVARRAVLFQRFGELWLELGREGFQARLEFAITERAAVSEAEQPEPAPDAQEHPQPEADVVEGEIVTAPQGGRFVNAEDTSRSLIDVPDVVVSDFTDV